MKQDLSEAIHENVRLRDQLATLRLREKPSTEELHLLIGQVRHMLVDCHSELLRAIRKVETCEALLMILLEPEPAPKEQSDAG
jgi:hypothetical protein